MSTDKKLDFWFKHGRNVLFVGKHGCGKTASIKCCFERNGLIHNKTYLYFSASTLDPWVDLVGVPEKVEKDGKVFLELVRPKALASGEVEAIFFDEFNRAPKKVRNAVMELMQFKSINGMVFPNLKCVWAAINPEEEDTYDVEKIDPAQKDRFHIIQNIPYKPNKEWFITRYGEDTAISAIEWWNDLPDEEKNKISPRRLEYALNEFEIGGSLQDVLPSTSNVNKLVQALKNGPVEAKLTFLYEQKDNVKTKQFLANDNNFSASVKHIVGNEDYLSYFVPLMPKERIVALMSEYSQVCRSVCHIAQSNKEMWNLLREIVMAGQDEKLVKLLHRYVADDDNLPIKDTTSEEPEKPQFLASPHKISYANFIGMTCIPSASVDNYFHQIKQSLSKYMTEDDALNCLLALGEITKDSWATCFMRPEFKGILGVINHCLQVLKDTNKYTNVLEALITEHRVISKLFIKLQQANMFKNVLRV
jgi:hypothetical protein